MDWLAQFISDNYAALWVAGIVLMAAAMGFSIPKQ